MSCGASLEQPQEEMDFRFFNEQCQNSYLLNQHAM